MRNIGLGPILLLLIFILIPLARYVLAQMRRHLEQPSPTPQPVPELGLHSRVAPAPMPASSVPRERLQAAPAKRALAPSRRQWSRNTLFRTPRDVQRTVVAMTILGTCRAYDPPG